MLITALLWLAYGIIARDFYIFGGNTIGLYTGLYYTMTALSVDSNVKNKTRVEICTFGFLLACPGVFFWVTYLNQETAMQIVGILGNIAAVAMFMSPLSTTLRVIREKDSASLNLPFMIFQIGNCTCWSLYGIATDQPLIIPPNALGLVFGIMQVCLKVRYPSSKIPMVKTIDALPSGASIRLNESIDSLLRSQTSIQLNDSNIENAVIPQ